MGMSLWSSIFRLFDGMVLPASSGSNGTVVGLLLDPEDVGNTHLRNIGKYLPVQTVPEVFNLQQEQQPQISHWYEANYSSSFQI
jgi:hypothetical protein